MYQVTFKEELTGHGRDRGFRASPADVLLALAKNHNLNIPFDCEDGECGSCAVMIEEVGEKSAHHMTERELDTLIRENIITKAEADEAIEKDEMTKVRLACQCKVWADIIVKPFKR